MKCMISKYYYFRYLATGTNISALHFDFLLEVFTIAIIVKKTCEILWDVLQLIEMPVSTTEDKL